MGRGEQGRIIIPPFPLLLPSCPPIGSQLLVSMVMALDWWAGPAGRVGTEERAGSLLDGSLESCPPRPPKWPLHPLDPTDPHFQGVEEKGVGTVLFQARQMEIGQCDRDLAVEKGRAGMVGFGIKQINKRLKIERQAKRQRLK